MHHSNRPQHLIIFFICVRCRTTHPDTGHQRAGIPSGLELRLIGVDLEPLNLDNIELVVIHNQGYPDLWLRKN
jgi:hypothetical protein